MHREHMIEQKDSLDGLGCRIFHEFPKIKLYIMMTSSKNIEHSFFKNLKYFSKKISMNALILNEILVF